MNTNWLEVLAVLAMGALMLLWVHRRNRADRGPPPRLPRSGVGDGTECEVIPRRAAAPDELKRLAGALGRWIAENAVPSITTAYALADLRAGELPQPLSVALELYLDDSLTRRGLAPPTGVERVERHQQILERLGQMAMSRAVFLRIPDAQQAGASLRAAIPAELVEDIFVNHRSWDAPE